MGNTNSKLRLPEIPRPKNRKGLVVFFISILIATAFWFLRSFDQTYQTSQNINVVYKHVPEGMALKNALPKQIEIRFESTGWEILKLKRFQRRESLQLDLRKYPEHKTIETATLLSAALPEDFASLKLLFVSPARMDIEYDKKVVREVAVEPNIELSLANQYGLSAACSVHPAFVKISGPASEVAKIASVKTRFTKFENVDHKLVEAIGLEDLSNRSISYLHSDFQITIPVERLTEGSMTIEVEIGENFSDTVSLIPDRVVIKYQAAISVFPRIDEKDFSVFVADSEFRNDDDDKLKLSYSLLKDYIYKVSLSPDYVDYIVIK
jgi:YbbR domain-containing protein